MSILEKEIRIKDLRKCIEEGLDSQVKHIEYCQEIGRLEEEINELKLVGPRRKVWINLKDGWKKRVYKHEP